MAAIYVNGVKTSCMAIGGGGSSPLQFKTWAHLDGVHAFALDINIQASYDHKITFEWYDAVEDDDGYRFSIYNGSWFYCRRRYRQYYMPGPGNGGSQFWAGNIGETHLMINNDEEHKNYIDGNYIGDVTNFSQSGTATYNQYWIGGQYSAGSSHAYIKQFKIESISTGDTICNLVPCLFDNTVHCLYDTINKRFYYCDGLQVMDTIPTT